jgi:SAM-dependent methyltransferase
MPNPHPNTPVPNSASSPAPSHEPGLASDSGPSAWLRRYSHLIKPQGMVLDIAAGNGRNTRWLAEQGFKVEAVDRDTAALDSMQAIANITPRQADLENGDWPYSGRQFDAIVVCRYLHRPLLPLLASSLSPQGILVYETYMQGHEIYGHPRNPDFLLVSNELLTAFSSDLEILAFEQGLLEQSPPAMLQRICAIQA